MLALAGGGGAARAERANGHWTVERVAAEHDVRCLVADPLAPGVFWAGTQGQGVLRSGDDGRSWRPAGLDGLIVKSLAPSPHEPGVVYAGTKSPPAVYVTRDGGGRWQELEGFRRARRWFWLSPAEPPFSAYVLALAVSPADPDVILAGIEAGAVLRSADGGRSWSGHCKGADRDCHQLAFHPADPSRVYQAGGGGPAVSEDGGLTWRHPTAGLDRRYCWNVALDPVRPEVWYAVTAPMFKAHSPDSQAYVFRSAGGAPWQRLNGGLPAPFRKLPALAADPAAPGQLYLSTMDGAVWHSPDYGDSWQRLPVNLGPHWFSLLVR
jgi:photosystem II stability/assembly factor-like uncharacterized protein